ncbi:hypothetical protein ACFVS2_26060 [Brevibacillus sp. NPDC058079]|uniref:hypothetical protein n=1 Tax=Brevibacillus sp. NPDC058079 TaxID=3346330 RepID=UPI0036E6AD2F
MNKMKTYYHVSREIHKEIQIFVPKIPNSFLVTGNENRCIKRVCVSEHIIECMNAINYYADKDMYDPLSETYKPLRVYKFELDEREVVPPEEVYQQGVHDAIINKECWVLNEVRPTKTFIIQPTYLATGNISPIHIAYMDFEIVDEDLNVVEPE